MPTRSRRIFLSMLVALFALATSVAHAAIPRTINYQGTLLTNGGTPVTSAAMTFRIYNATDVAPLYIETQFPSLTSSGSFNVQIGATTALTLPFDVPYWLTVAINGDAEMSPRQPLNAAPYALHAASAGALSAGATISSSQISGTIGSAQLSASQLLPTTLCPFGAIPKSNGAAWTCGGDNDTNSGGTVTSVTAGAGLTGGTITGVGTIDIDPTSNLLLNNFFKIGGNYFGLGTVATIGSTTMAPVEIVVNNTRALRIEPTADSPNIALGSAVNSAGGAGVRAATVGGGGLAGSPNLATADFATVGGGMNNQAQAQWSTVGGGLGNTASQSFGTVAGGANNAAGNYSAVGGGYGNNASGGNAAIAGGSYNAASGYRATIPGGEANSASGGWSFAAGYGAKANADGCFVWADGAEATFPCNTANTFMVRATGGVNFRTSTYLVNGCSLAPGGGAWACTSSRETKKDFAAMNPLDVLKRVINLPVTQWRYQAEVSGARHVGPMAEDFHAAFGLGDSDKTINVIDASGVALAAIQGLNQLVVNKDAEIQTQSKRIKLLEDALVAIQSKLGMR